jgi:hypothetical protein
MKSLYHPKYLSLNEAGQDIDHMTVAAIRDIFEFWVKEGYSPREISQVMQGAIQMEELGAVLEIASKEHKKDKTKWGKKQKENQKEKKR